MCHCGSRLWHLFDLDQNQHFAVCYRKQHKAVIDKPWAPTLFDFFCECGGVFFPTTNCVTLGNGAEILRDFVCPACATRWRFAGAGPEAHDAPSQHDALTLALAHATEINRAAIEQRPDIVADIAILRRYVSGPPISGFKRFWQNMFSTWDDPAIPPSDMPEKQRYLSWVLEMRERFDSRIQEEVDAGLLVWCKSGD